MLEAYAKGSTWELDRGGSTKTSQKSSDGPNTRERPVHGGNKSVGSASRRESALKSIKNATVMCTKNPA